MTPEPTSTTSERRQEPSTFVLLGSERSFEVVPDCFDVRFPTAIAGVAYESFLPSTIARSVDEDFQATEAIWADVYGRTWKPSDLQQMRSTDGRLDRGHGSVAPAIVLASPMDSKHVAESLVHGVDSWRDTFYAWLSAFTGQDMNVQHPLWGAKLQAAGVEVHRSDGSPVPISTTVQVTMSDEIPASQTVLACAFLHAATAEMPPGAHLLLRDAREALHRAFYYPPMYRRAVIDAGTAAETALAGAAKNAGQETEKLTLGRLVTKAADLGLIDAEERDRFIRDLVTPRNVAVHGGLGNATDHDASETARNAYVAACDLVSRFVPLPEV